MVESEAGRFLLDTSVLVRLERGGLPIFTADSDDDDFAIASITVSEFMVGVLLAPPAQQQARKRFAEQLLARLPVLAFDEPIARSHAELAVECRRDGRPRGAHDLIIAATAAATGRTILTEDRRGFADLPGVQVRLVRPEPG